MGISILEPVLNIDNEELCNWLWRLPICCGFEKRASALLCERCARNAADLMREHKEQVLDGIRERLASHGFDAEAAYRDWLLSLQKIVEASRTAEKECVWSAPSHPKDVLKSVEK